MKLRLIKKKQENSDTISFLFKPEESLIYKAGQYLRYHIKNPSPDERGENRFFSISSAPFENIIRLSTKFALNGNRIARSVSRERMRQDAVYQSHCRQNCTGPPHVDHFFVLLRAREGSESILLAGVVFCTS
jgi:hypothetical protein